VQEGAAQQVATKQPEGEGISVHYLTQACIRINDKLKNYSDQPIDPASYNGFEYSVAQLYMLLTTY
jgi:hypothetical protein